MRRRLQTPRDQRDDFDAGLCPGIEPNAVFRR